MHQSGHSRAHSMQTVQFSSNSAITPRLRGGRSGCTSGYCRVCGPPGHRPQRDGEPAGQPGRPGPPAQASSRSLTQRHRDDAGEHELGQRDRHQHQPAEPLQLVLAQPRVGHPEPDHHEGQREHLDQRPQPAELASANGPFQPPRNSTVVSAAITTMPGVLGEQEEREPQPGVLGQVAEHQLRVGDRHVERRPPDLGQPGDEEDHHRRAPARAATTAATPRRCRSATACPAAIADATPRPARTAARTPSSWAAPRSPPSREYLFALAQAAISMPTTPTPTMASTRNSPMSSCWPTRPGPSGMHEQHQQVRQQRRRPAPAGTPACRPRPG